MAGPPEERSGPTEPRVASHQAFDPRLLTFYFIVAAILLALAGGAAYRQLIQNGAYGQTERLQQERRVLLPGPRGLIYDRHHRLLVGNRSRFSVVLYLDELQSEFQKEAARIRANYRTSGDSDVTWGDMVQIARVSVVQRYLDQVDSLLGRTEILDVRKLNRHFREQLLIPYTLADDLSPEDFARLVENLPVASPLQVTYASARSYPFGSAASHVLGYVTSEDNVEAEDFPGADLMTFKMKGTMGSDGLEKEFDERLQGRAGGTIYRVDPAGYRVNPPVATVMPQPGRDLTTSLDIDMQKVAEDAIGDGIGSAVALDVRTGEVLVLASKPDYDLNDFPHNAAAVAEVNRRQAWTDTAVAGRYPPGSTFKILVSIAGLLSGRLSPTDDSVDCEGYVRIGNRLYGCDSGKEEHGRLQLAEAIGESCDIYFYLHGIAMGPETIVAQAHRMHLDGRTGIELPVESRSLLPNIDQLRREHAWNEGDTAIISIGQGAITETPLSMACFAASVARGEIWTKPTLLHDPDRADQHTESIGLSPAQRDIIVRGMEETITDPHGTAHIMTSEAMKDYAVPGVVIASKTGTATLPDKTDAAWFICFAPADQPQVAVAVVIKGDTAGEEFNGGRFAAPVAARILQAYFKVPIPRAAEQTGDSPGPGSP